MKWEINKLHNQSKRYDDDDDHVNDDDDGGADDDNDNYDDGEDNIRCNYTYKSKHERTEIKGTLIISLYTGIQ